MKEKSRCNFKERCITGSKLAGPWFFSIAEKPPSMRSLPLRGPKLFFKKNPKCVDSWTSGKKKRKKEGGGYHKEGSGLWQTRASDRYRREHQHAVGAVRLCSHNELNIYSKPQPPMVKSIYIIHMSSFFPSLFKQESHLQLYCILMDINHHLSWWFL